MKITVTTGTQQLGDMLSSSDNASINSDPTGLPFDITIRNEDSTNTISLELGADATTASGFPIKAGESFSFVTHNLSRVNLIADADIADCFLIIH